MSIVIRPTWRPENDEQRELLAAAIRDAKIADDAQERAWASIVRARDAGVPDTLLCDQTNRSRATFNRRFGTRSTPTAIVWTGKNLPEIQALRPDARLINGELHVNHAETGQPTRIPRNYLVHRQDPGAST